MFNKYRTFLEKKFCSIWVLGSRKTRSLDIEASSFIVVGSPDLQSFLDFPSVSRCDSSPFRLPTAKLCVTQQKVFPTAKNFSHSRRRGETCHHSKRHTESFPQHGRTWMFIGGQTDTDRQQTDGETRFPWTQNTPHNFWRFPPNLLPSVNPIKPLFS